MEKSTERESITLLKVLDMKVIISKDIVKVMELSIMEMGGLLTPDL